MDSKNSAANKQYRKNIFELDKHDYEIRFI